MNIIDELGRFGLNNKQANIYYLLLMGGDMRIQELVSRSGIPRSSVYEILKALLKRGLVEEIVEDNFKKIRAYSLDTIQFELAEEISRLKKSNIKLQNLKRAMESQKNLKYTPPINIRYYKGRAGARQILWNSLRTNNLVQVYSEWGRSRYVGVEFYKRFVAESKQRQIKENVLINPSARALGSIKHHTNSPTSRTKVEDIRVVRPSDIQINGEAFMYDDVYAQVYLHQDEINGFEIQNKQFVENQKSIFRFLWRSAEDVSTYL